MVKPKKILCLGTGLTAQSIARYYFSQNQAISLIEPNPMQPLPDGFQAQHAALNNALLQGVTDIIISPGFPRQHAFIQKALAQNIAVIGDIELFARHAKAPIIAITGTNGKSTVTQWLGDTLNALGKIALIGGNIGVPALDLLQQPVPDFYVLELSSYQLESTQSLKAQIAILLNITEDHCDRYNGFEEYKNTKHILFKNAKYKIYNQNDNNTTPLNTHNSLAFNSEFEIINNNGETTINYLKKPLLNTKNLKLIGHHNYENACCILTVILLLKLDLNQASKALCLFNGLAHRMQWVAEKNKVTYINDSKATNCGAAIAAIHGLSANASGNIIWLLGGQGKDQNFSVLNSVAEFPIACIITFGEDAQHIKQAVQQHFNVRSVSSMQDAIEMAHRCAQPYDTVLLSPACASFDAFQSYSERGDVFTQAVLRMGSNPDI